MPRRSAADARRSRAAGSESNRNAYFGRDAGWLQTNVIGREALSSSARNGPLVIEEYEGTTVVPPDAYAVLDEHGNIVIRV